MEKETRRKELSGMFLEMSRALLSEGSSLSDYTITQSGSLMLLLSNLMLSDQDMMEFSQISSMFSAKKIVQNFRGVNNLDSFDGLMQFIENMENNFGAINKPTSKPRKKINNQERIILKNKAFVLHDKGKSYREIASELGIGKSTVERWLKEKRS